MLIKISFIPMEMKIQLKCQKKLKRKVKLELLIWYQMVLNSFKKLPKNKRKQPNLKVIQTQAQIPILTLIEKIDSLI